MKTKRALFVISNCGLPSVDGNGQRTALIYSAINKLFNVDILVFGNEKNPDLLDYYKDANSIELFVYPPFEETIPKLVRRMGSDNAVKALLPLGFFFEPDRALKRLLKGRDPSNYDLIVGRYLRPICRAGFLQRSGSVPVIIDLDDRDDALFLSRSKNKDTNIALRSLFYLKSLEAKALITKYLKLSNHIWAPSDDDRVGLPDVPISTLPNIPFAFPKPLPDTNTNLALNPESVVRLLFVGSAHHGPNFRGVARFLTKVWPRLRERMPRIEFDIVGSGEWSDLPAALSSQAGVNVVGYALSLEEYYRKADIVVVPIYEGAGTNIKVIEAAAYGRCVVGAPKSAYGMPDDMRAAGLSIASTDAQFVDHIARLASAPQERATRAKAARASVDAFFTPEAFERTVIEACRSVVGVEAP